MMKSLANFFQAFPRYFFLLFAVFFIVCFFALYESFRVYRAEAELIVISHGSTVSAEGAAVTLSHIPPTLSFYNRLREEHGNISDPWAGESSVDRKLAWGRVIESSIVPGSDVIRLSVVGSDSLQASELLSASIETLYGFSGRLYNRNTEAETRLLEDVIVHSVVTSVPILFLLSAVCAILVALLVSLFLQNSSSFLKRATLPDISLFRAKYIPAHSGMQVKEGIRPVGSFPDIMQEESHSPSEAPVISHDSAPLTLRVLPTEEISPSSNVNDVDESVLSAAEPVENDKDKESSPNEVSSESVSREEKGENYESRMNNEPEDIWEKPRLTSVGRMRINMRQTGIEDASQKKTSEIVHTEVQSDTISDRSGRRADVPGNLVTVSAQDFTWDKFLFQDEEDASKKQKKTEDVNEGEVEELKKETTENAVKHEPTPEELKARLNQLLRGEL